MRFSFITLFSDLISGYFNESILFRARENGLINVDFVNPRDFSKDKHNKVDFPMVGGGAGMLMMPEPLIDSIRSVKSKDCRVVMLSPVGKKFTQKDAIRLSGFPHLILISGRYEGIDERVVESEVDEVFSIGDFILTGGELASLVVCDSIARNIDGVLDRKSVV